MNPAIKTLAKAVLDAAEIREASWNKQAYEQDKKDAKLEAAKMDLPAWAGLQPDADQYYTKTLMQASDEAALKHDLDGASGLIYTALLSWNDALDWATRVVEGGTP